MQVQSQAVKHAGFTLTPEQEAVMAWVKDGKGSAVVEAVAGSGKTATLSLACGLMEGQVAATAFNAKIAEEFGLKVKAFPNVLAKTFHSYGFAAWRKELGDTRVEVEARGKNKMMLTAAESKIGWAPLSALVSLAKQAGVIAAWDIADVDEWNRLIDHYDVMLKVKEEQKVYGLSLKDNKMTPDEQRECLIEEAQWCVLWALDKAKGADGGGAMIDFDDMIWCPLVEGSPVEQYDWVLVDEAQDTNVTRRMLAERMLRDGGRSMWVGDRHQAIYGFTGADSDALDLIADKFDATLLPLSVTFRCCKRATELAQQFVPHITAHEDNVEGSVSEADTGQMTATEGGDGVVVGDAILCRLTAPLVELAYQLIRSGVPAHVEGRDIGKGLEALATKWASATTAVELTRKLDSYLKREREKLEARDEEYKIEALQDRVTTLFVIMDGCDTVAEVTAKIKRLFQDTNGGRAKDVTLSTIHKAKGREWDKVWVLGWEEYMPSKWARQDWEMQQEANLQYVAVTRAKMALVLVSVPPRS
jgi:superfamily I DNA/RNA helicase